MIWQLPKLQAAGGSGVPQQIILNARNVHAIIRNNSAVDVQICDSSGGIAYLTNGAFTDGVTLAPGETLSLLGWNFQALWAASASDGASLVVIVDQSDDELLNLLRAFLNQVASQRPDGSTIGKGRSLVA